MNNCEEIGSLDRNLILKTKGQVYIRYGQKHLELLDRNGNLNVKIPKIIKQTDSLDNLSDGFYIYNNELYLSFNKEARKLLQSNNESDFLNQFNPIAGDFLMFDGNQWKLSNLENLKEEIKKELTK